MLTTTSRPAPANQGGANSAAPRSAMRATPARSVTPSTQRSRTVSPAPTSTSYASSPPPSRSPSLAPERASSPAARPSTKFGRGVSVPPIHFASASKPSHQPSVLTRSASRSSLRSEDARVSVASSVASSADTTPAIRNLPVVS